MSDAETTNPFSSRTSSAILQFRAPTVGLCRFADDGKHIGATEHFDLYLAAVGAQCVELLRQVADTEIHKAVAVGEAESVGQDRRALGKTPWHSAPAPNRALQNVTPMHDPRIVRKIAGRRARYSSPG